MRFIKNESSLLYQMFPQTGMRGNKEQMMSFTKKKQKKKLLFPEKKKKLFISRLL